ncbi:hypothetical protein RIF29_45482 [Crotalaria pallida]|uniref:Uncharacterized protein n=1 Tax=Crotalaria pallida TaxID=3830 RepID=A0AAN9DWU5_CROPI
MVGLAASGLRPELRMYFANVEFATHSCEVREGLRPSGDRLRETLSIHTGEVLSRARLYWAEVILSLPEEQVSFYSLCLLANDKIPMVVLLEETFPSRNGKFSVSSFLEFVPKLKYSRRDPLHLFPCKTELHHDAATKASHEGQTLIIEKDRQIMLDHWILRARLLSIPYGLKQIATSWLDLGLSTTPIMVRAKQRIHVPRRGEFGNITSRKEKVPALIGGLQKKLWRLTPNLRRLDVAGTYKLFPSATGSVPEDRQGFNCFLSLRREKGGDPRIKRVKEPFLFADRLGALA